MKSWHDRLNALLRANPGNDTVRVAMPDGRVLALTFCGRKADLLDPMVDVDRFEWVLVSGGGVSHAMGGTPEQVCGQLEGYSALAAEYENDLAELKAFCRDHAGSDDPEDFGLFSDWHKDVYGYRPHGWTCDALCREAQMV